MVVGAHRLPGGHRIACTRTHVSGLRFGTLYESGINIQEAQYCTHFPKDRNCESLLTIQNDKGSLQKTQWRSSLLRAEKFCDLITADHKVLNVEGESRNNHIDTLSWYKILPLDGFSLISVKRRLHMRQRKVHESSSSRRTNQKL